MNDPLASLLPHLGHAMVCDGGALGRLDDCVCDVRLAVVAARAAIKMQQPEPVTIACGRTYIHDGAEAVIRAMREQEGFATGGGCGRDIAVDRLLSLSLYRCVECGRFMHKHCILAHFDETAHDKAVAPAPAVDREHVRRLAELALANLRDVNGPYVGLASHQVKLIVEATAP